MLLRRIIEEKRLRRLVELLNKQYKDNTNLKKL
jgi:hypothetical protein